jgi:hypothetical protein
MAVERGALEAQQQATAVHRKRPAEQIPAWVSSEQKSLAIKR